MPKVFEVEKVLNRRIMNGNVEYLLKWKAFTAQHNLWVVESDVNCKDLIEEYEFKEILGVRRDDDCVNYLVIFKHQKPKVFTSCEMREKWPVTTVKYLEKLIEYVSNDDSNLRTAEMTSVAGSQIGKAIQVLYAAKVGRKYLYLIQFENSNKFLTSDNARALCPDLVLDYLESNLNPTDNN